jgi:hypothetical protein
MLRYLAALLVLLALALPARVGAQEYDAIIQSVEDRDAQRWRFDIPAAFVNRRECQKDISFRLRVVFIPEAASVLDFWWSSGDDCSRPENRSDTIRRGCEPRILQEDQFVPGQEKTLTISMSELVNCDEGQSGTQHIYILATNQLESTGPAEGWLKMDIGVDTVPPAPPKDPRPRNGENSVGIAWTAAEGAQNLREHLVFAHYGGCGHIPEPAPPPPADAGTTTDGGTTGVDGGADGEPEDAGMAEDGGTGVAAVTSALTRLVSCGSTGIEVEVPTGFECVGSVSQTSTSATVDHNRLPLGGQVAIAVSAVDLPQNPSDLAYVCATRVPTIGFCEARGGCPSACSVDAVGATRSPWGAIAGLALIALLLVVRRRFT